MIWVINGSTLLYYLITVLLYYCITLIEHWDECNYVWYVISTLKQLYTMNQCGYEPMLLD